MTTEQPQPNSASNATATAEPTEIVPNSSKYLVHSTMIDSQGNSSPSFYSDDTVNREEAGNLFLAMTTTHRLIKLVLTDNVAEVPDHLFVMHDMSLENRPARKRHQSNPSHHDSIAKKSKIGKQLIRFSALHRPFEFLYTLF